MFLFLFLFLAIIVGIVVNVKVVPQSKAYVIETLGAYKTTWNTGLHVKIPFLERVVKVVSLKEQVIDFPPSNVITKDNVTVRVDSIVFFQITDPKLYTYGVEKPIQAIDSLASTTLRNIFGALELDQSLASRDFINAQITEVLDKATDKWGIKVNRVELKSIEPPASIQEAMEKQMKAERERRESILRAEGEKTAMVLEAEGKKESTVLNAEADKMAAELRAEAEKIKRIKEAEGEADAIRTVRQAQVDAYDMLNKLGMKPATIQVRALEALEKMADGKASKIIVPSELQGMAGLLGAGKEIIDGAMKLDGLSKDDTDLLA